MNITMQKYFFQLKHIIPVVLLCVMQAVSVTGSFAATGPVPSNVSVTPDPTGGISRISVEGKLTLPVTEKRAGFEYSRIITGSTGTDKTGAAKTAASQVIEAGNAHIAASVDNRGEFVATTVDGDPLLYTGDWDFTGLTMIRIDGVSYRVGQSPGEWTKPLSALNGEITGIWSIRGIDVFITIMPVESPVSEREDALLASYRLENTNDYDCEVGFYKMLDIVAAGNDSAPVWVLNNHSLNEREYEGAEIPNFWHVYADAPDQPVDALMIEGVLNEGPAVRPDRFVVGDWGRLTRVTWEYEPVGEYEDSAVGMWWNPKTLTSGGSRTVATMLGAGTPLTAGTDLVLRMTSLKKVSVRNGEIRPDQIQVSAVLINATGRTVEDVELELVHGDKLELYGDMPGIVTIGKVNAGEWLQIVWTLVADKSGIASQDYVNVVARTSQVTISGAVIESHITIPESVDPYISEAEAFVGDDPGEGNGVVMTASDGDFNGESEEVVASIDITGLPYGEHTVTIRGRDSDGVWGETETATFVHSPPSLQSIEIDSDIALIGSQHQSTLYGIGPRERIGFAVYINGNVSMRSFVLDLDWNSSKAELKSSSGANVPDDDRDINGVDGLIYAEENNILVSDGGQMSKIEMADEPGHYKVNWAKLGGEPSTVSQGLLYFAEFKTTESFTPDMEFAVTVSATLLDDNGNETPITPAVFKILPHSTYQPPTNVRTNDVPDDHGHKLELSWSISQDDIQLMHYNIYRSRSPRLTKVVPLESLATLDEMIEMEASYTILLDQVPRGTGYYLDQCVPLDGVKYYYWVESVGENGTSEKVAASLPVSVEDRPVEVAIFPASPNPFNPSTAIKYRLTAPLHVSAVIYDLLGRKVRIIEDSMREAGYHSIVWNGDDDRGMTVGAGVYIYSIQAGVTRKTGKVTFQK